MNAKITALALLSVVAIAAIAGGLLLALQPTVKADTPNSVASDSELTPLVSSITTTTDNNTIGFGGFGGPFMMGEPRLGMGFRGDMRGGFGPGAIQVSSDYTANVTAIAQSDSDVQNLISQGYNITSIHPVISTTIDGNGNVVTQAPTANVLMVGNNGSHAYLVVDLSQNKVTKIVTVAVTEIDK